jgi:hypothetical protein
VRGSAQRLALTVAIAIVFAILVFGHVRYVNGPDYWQWAWQRRGDFLLAAIVLAVAAVPAFIGNVLRNVALIAVSVIALQFAANAIQVPIRGVERINSVAHDQLTTSYFTVAESIVKANGIDWLGQYDQLLRLAPQHATTKPPGPVALYVTLIRVFGPQRAPLAIAIAISLLSACAVIAAWWATKTIAGDDAGLIAATLLALSPSMTLFFLYLDPIYPIFSCALLGTWYLTLERESRGAAVIFGLLLFLTTMTGYTLLVVGVALGGMTLTRLRRRSTYALAAIAIGVTIVAHALFALVTGFNPTSAFRTAMAMQAYQLPLLHRPWPKSIPFDILDFLLGCGWAPIVPAILGLKQRRSITIACFATPFVVALTGLIQTETARVWIFLLPLLFLPAALEMQTWMRRQRIAVYAAQLIVLIALYTNMVFIER